MSKTRVFYIVEALGDVANLLDEIADYHIEESHPDFQITKDSAKSARDLIRCGICQEIFTNCKKFEGCNEK